MKRTVFFITRSAVVAAIYFALATALQPISFGPVQFRLSEALVLLPVFMPESIIGVTLGCFLSNFFYSTMYDVIFGTIATAVAAVLTYLLRRTKFLYVLPPLLLNALLRFLHPPVAVSDLEAGCAAHSDLFHATRDSRKRSLDIRRGRVMVYARRGAGGDRVKRADKR